MRRGGLGLGLLAAALILAVLGSGTATRDTVDVATPTADPLTATPGRAPTAPTDAPATTLPLPPAFPTATTASPHRNLVATVKGESIDVFGAPDEATPVAWTLPNPRASGSEQVFLVIGARTGWLNVMVPVRPNGSTGSIRSADITLAGHDFSIVVELGAHKLTVFEGDAVWAEEPVGVGVDTTPTPGGRFYTVELFASQKAAYGPYAYGLSGYSEVHLRLRRRRRPVRHPRHERPVRHRLRREQRLHPHEQRRHHPAGRDPPHRRPRRDPGLSQPTRSAAALRSA